MRLEKIAERTHDLERAATLRAGLITSAIYNVHRRKGAAPLKPEDFVRREVQHVDGRTLRGLVRDWLGRRSYDA